jgi:Flp pilus assembly protein TadG
MAPAPHDDRGSAAVEMAIVAPAIFLMLMLVIFAGRVTDAKQQVISAADAAARAASLRGDEVSALAAAEAAAEANLKDGGLTCTPATVEFEQVDLAPGGNVTVVVSCQANLTNVALPGIQDLQTFSARSTEVVDRYRGSG